MSVLIVIIALAAAMSRSIGVYSVSDSFFSKYPGNDESVLDQSLL